MLICKQSVWLTLDGLQLLKRQKTDLQLFKNGSTRFLKQLEFFFQFFVFFFNFYLQNSYAISFSIFSIIVKIVDFFVRFLSSRAYKLKLSILFLPINLGFSGFSLILWTVKSYFVDWKTCKNLPDTRTCHWNHFTP